MPKTYQIRKVVPNDFYFYRACLLNGSWKKNYGTFKKKKLDQCALELAAGDYQDVNRFLVLRQSIPIGFFHLQGAAGSHECTLAGGTHPKTIGQGYGLKVAAIALDYIFRKVAYDKVNCTVLVHNHTSRRMLLALGFRQEGIAIARRHERDVTTKTLGGNHFFRLLKSEYPNSLAVYLLSRLSYEQI